MDKIIQYVVGCDTLYGVAALVILFIGLALLGLIILAILCVALPYIYKIICKWCNTYRNYKVVHTKLGVKDVSFETDLHQ